MGQDINARPRDIPRVGTKATPCIGWGDCKYLYLEDFIWPLIVFKYRNVLDEWASGIPKTVKLECDDYGLVYDAILSGLEAVEKDKIDGPLLHQRLTSWAGFGMYVSPQHLDPFSLAYLSRSMNASVATPRISTEICLKLSST